MGIIQGQEAIYIIINWIGLFMLATIELVD